MSLARHSVATAVAAMLVAACVQGSPREQSAPERVLLITDVTIINGAEASPAEMSILIRGNRIAEIAPPERLSIPETAQVHDGAGRFVIPGLWDMHTHVLWQPFVADGFLRLFLVNGVTGVRDMGGTLDVLGEVRAMGRHVSPLNPRIVAAGPWLNAFEIDPRAGVVVQTAEEARETVSRLARAGVDFIKVYTALERDVFLAILEEAAAHGLPVAGHVPYSISSREASDLGMRGLEHLRVETGGFCAEVGDVDCPGLLDDLRRNGTWQTPTLVVRRNRALLDQPGDSQYPGVEYAPSYLSSEWAATRDARLGTTASFDEVRRQWESELALARVVHEAGLKILAGSDAGDLYSVAGFSIHQELALLVEAGLTPGEALQTATIEAADYLAATDSLGSVEVGKLADFVILEANPLEDIRNTKKIHAVVRDGQLYDRADLDRILSEIATAATGP